MEMRAVIVGLDALTEPRVVEIYTDSQYVVNSMTKGWALRWKANNWMRNKNEPALNVDLWTQILALCGRHQVSFHWVRGHAGHPENERCDQLAARALKGSPLPDDLPQTP